jgi:hypothetical protein
MFCSGTPEMYKAPQQAFSPHIARGYATQQNPQPVIQVPPACNCVEYTMELGRFNFRESLIVK